MSSEARDFYRRMSTKLDYTSGGVRPQFNPGLALVMRELAEYVPFNAVNKRDRTAVAICSVNMLCAGTGYQERNMEQALKTLEEKGLIKRLPEYGSSIARRGPDGELYSPVNGYFLVDYAAEIGHELTQAEIDRATRLVDRNRERGRSKARATSDPKTGQTVGSDPVSSETVGADPLSGEPKKFKPIQGSPLIRSTDHPEGKGDKVHSSLRSECAPDATEEAEPATKRIRFPRPERPSLPSKKEVPDTSAADSRKSPASGKKKGSVLTKEQVGQRDAVFNAWREHLVERWGYALDSSAYGEEKNAAWNLARRGYTAEQVVQVYDACRDDWDVAGHLRLNAIIRHMEPRLKGVKGGRQANGRRLDAAEMGRGVVEGVQADQKMIDEILAAFG